MSAQSDLKQFLDTKQAQVDAFIDEYMKAKLEADNAYTSRLDELHNILNSAQIALDNEHIRLQELATKELDAKLAKEEAKLVKEAEKLAKKAEADAKQAEADAKEAKK